MIERRPVKRPAFETRSQADQDVRGAFVRRPFEQTTGGDFILGCRTV